METSLKERNFLRYVCRIKVLQDDEFVLADDYIYIDYMYTDEAGWMLDDLQEDLVYSFSVAYVIHKTAVLGLSPWS